MKTAMITILAFLLICCHSTSAVFAAEAVSIGTQKQLFIDDFIIANADGVFPVLNQPVKHPDNPVIEMRPPVTAAGTQGAVVFGSVLFDHQEKLFKMWYEVANYQDATRDLAYATSTDGVNWDLPCLDLVASKNWRLAGCGDREGANNIVFSNGSDGMAAGVFKDLQETDPDRRYKMLHASGANYTPLAPAFSPDGIHWKSAPSGPGMPYCDSFNPCMWDPGLGKYVAHTRNNAATPHGQERQVFQYESDDFINWTKIGTIVKADEHDALGDRHFYQMPWMRYEHYYIGLLDTFHLMPGREGKEPQHLWEDRVDVQLAFSRDNRHWIRAGDRQTFIPNSQVPGDYDFAVTSSAPAHQGDALPWCAGAKLVTPCESGPYELRPYE
ncbi:hypothetical protein OAS39_04625 [Pirellulales bacterium]|nr:hypothetical protein [Pirellulales bacterium]